MSHKHYQKADGIIDLRERTEFAAGHLINSTWMPYDSLAESLNQLPAAPASLFLVGGKQQIEEASVLLDSKGYLVSGSLVICATTLKFWQGALASDWVAGKESKQLWQPSNLVVEWLQTYRPVSTNQRLKVLDLGCGGGRDAVFLAKHKMDVIAVDHKANVIQRAKQLSQSAGAQVKFKCCDLAKVKCLPEPDQSKFDLILGVRFLNRALLPKLETLLNPEGFILWETFVDLGEPLASPKNPNFILQQGELAKVFSSLNIIIDRIQKLPDGRPVNSFVAQKPAN